EPSRPIGNRGVGLGEAPGIPGGGLVGRERLERRDRALPLEREVVDQVEPEALRRICLLCRLPVPARAEQRDGNEGDPDRPPHRISVAPAPGPTRPYLAAASSLKGQGPATD